LNYQSQRKELRYLSKRRYLFLCLFFLCLTAFLPAWGRKEKAETKTIDIQNTGLARSTVDKSEEEGAEQETTTFVQVTGIVRLVGSAFMPEIVITGSDREWYVSSEEDSLLRELQHRTVTVEGYESVIELRFVSGRYAGQRRTLKDIKIIAVEGP